MIMIVIGAEQSHWYKTTEQKFCSVLLFTISFHKPMYPKAKPVKRCQCCI